MMTKEQVRETLNKIPEARYMTELVDKINADAKRSDKKFGDYLFDLIASGDKPTTHYDPATLSPAAAAEFVAISARAAKPKKPTSPASFDPFDDDRLLGPELKHIYESGCDFEKSTSPQGMRLFCSKQGMLWDKRPSDLTDGQQRKLNVMRGFYWDWCDLHNVPKWEPGQ